MELTLKKELITAIGPAKFKPFGLNPDSMGWRDSITLGIARLEAGQLDALECLLATKPDVRGTKQLLADIATWRKACSQGPAKLKARTLKQFGDLLAHYLLKVPGHRIYSKRDEDWLPHYVASVRYHPPKEGRGGDYVPADVTVTIHHEELGGIDKDTIYFREDDARGIQVAEALVRKGYVVETPELRAKHQADVALFVDVHKRIGAQFFCTGIGLDNVDGNKEGDRDSWYWRRVHEIDMVRSGQPTRVVVDVFRETRDRHDSDSHVEQYFWKHVAEGLPAGEDEEDWGGDLGDLTDEPAEVPVHPFLVIFDLSKHLRLRVHVNQLTPYVYDPHLADKLVLPEDRKALVKLLIEMRGGGFQDIVKGKGGGAVVLLAGPPGTGKTLTAEVYAESEARALYSVQCSQLGTDPDGLEDELLKVFARSKRWNAVMLLDEADVYVHQRGNDLQQNAIVGVFLRVLEYQDSVLFLTTNRPEDVDDAIASRCIARLPYGMPSPEDQARIWRVLGDASQANLPDDVIQAIVQQHPGQSGRDVKNLLKLALLLAPDGITPEAVAFVKQFQPTGGAEPTVVALPGGIGRCPDCGVLVGKKGHTCRKARG